MAKKKIAVKEIWFQLVNPDGSRFLSYGPSCVELAVTPQLRILEFLRHVLSLDQFKRILPDVDPEQLRVYENQEAFEMQLAAAQDRKGKKRKVDRELGRSHLLAQLGQREQTAIWLVVPPISERTPGFKPKTLKTAISLDSLVKPEAFQPRTPPKSPPFTAPDNWLEDIVETIEKNMSETDYSGLERVPPMALVRCSRGGKTRALLEIAAALRKKHPEVAVIYVSFNNETSLTEDEIMEEDSLSPLLRRIAFVAQKSLNLAKSIDDEKKEITAQDFSPFRDMYFTCKDLVEWLDGIPCVLLIDELNLLGSMDSKFAQFIKETFLSTRNRYFVFSSHVVTAVENLASYMDSHSNRKILAPELPVVQYLAKISKNLDWFDLSPRKLLLYGCIPGLLVEARRNEAPSTKRSEAIKKCIKQNLINDNSVHQLLSTFLLGDHDLVPEPLLALMNTCQTNDILRIKWIPFHMMEAFRKFANQSHCSPWLKKIMEKISELFDTFAEAKEKSGDAWEALFVLALLIRCTARKFETVLLPLSCGETCCVSLNIPFRSDGMIFGSMTKVRDLIDRIPPSNATTTNHIAIYYPTNSQFEIYDVIVAYYDEEGRRNLYGYQLKEGKSLAKSKPVSCFVQSIIIQAQSADESKKANGWLVASEGQISEFFGDSGQMWTPKMWGKLISETESSRRFSEHQSDYKIERIDKEVHLAHRLMCSEQLNWEAILKNPMNETRLLVHASSHNVCEHLFRTASSDSIQVDSILWTASD